MPPQTTPALQTQSQTQQHGLISASQQTPPITGHLSETSTLTSAAPDRVVPHPSCITGNNNNGAVPLTNVQAESRPDDCTRNYKHRHPQRKTWPAVSATADIPSGIPQDTPSQKAPHAGDATNTDTSFLLPRNGHHYYSYLTKKDMESTTPVSKPAGSSNPAAHKPEIPSISTEEWRDGKTFITTDRRSSHGSSSPMEQGSDSVAVVRRKHKKPISRSRSDLTKRFSNSSDLSEISARFSRNSADLDRFFNEMGLDRSVLEPMMLSSSTMHAQSSSSLHVFESVSSIGSTDHRSWCNENGSDRSGEMGLKSAEVERTPGGPTSVVERNARIIKWLCNVKKAPSNPSLSPSHGSTD